MTHTWRQIWWEPINIVNTDYTIEYDAVVKWRCERCQKEEKLTYYRRPKIAAPGRHTEGETYTCR